MLSHRGVQMGAEPAPCNVLGILEYVSILTTKVREQGASVIGKFIFSAALKLL